MIDFPANPSEGQGFAAAGKQYTYSNGVWSGGGVPVVGGYAVGDLVLTAGNTAPQGTFKANGALVSRTVYADLFARIGTTFGAGDGATTFALPDWRGEFFRAWDDGRGVDSNRVLNSAQRATGVRTTMMEWVGADVNSAAASYIFGQAFANQDSAATYIGADAPPGAAYSPSAGNWNPGVMGDNVALAGASSTGNGSGYGANIWITGRPRNVALLACIAYRNGAGGGLETVVVPGADMTMPHGILRTATDLNNEHAAAYLLFNAATLNLPAANTSGHVEVIPAINNGARPTVAGNWTLQRAVTNENPPRTWVRRYDGGAGTWSAWGTTVQRSGDTMSGALKWVVAGAGAGAPIEITMSDKDDCPLLFNGNLLQFFKDGHMLYARDGSIKWGWHANGDFYSNGSLVAGSAANAQYGQLGQGFIELRLPHGNGGPYIDFSDDYSDYHWRIQSVSNDRLRFYNWNGRYHDLLNDGNIYSEGRGYVWDAIGQRVRKISGNDIGIEWAGGDNSYRAYVDGVNRWNFFCSEDNRVRSAWAVGNNYLRIYVDGTAYAVNFVPSDRRLKDNIGPAKPGALATVLAIPVCEFDWNEDSLAPGVHVDYGIVAQDAIAAYPAIAFRTEPERDNGMWTQDVQATVNLLLKAVQELAAEVAELRQAATQ